MFLASLPFRFQIILFVAALVFGGIAFGAWHDWYHGERRAEASPGCDEDPAAPERGSTQAVRRG